MTKTVSSILGLSLFVALMFPSLAGELAGRVDAFVSDFNSQARSLGLNATLMETKCDTRPVASCKFSAANGIEGFVQSNEGSLNPSMIMIAKGNAPVPDFVLALRVTMTMYAGDVAKEERGAALMGMLKKVTEENVTGTARLGGANFSMRQMNGYGLVAFVKADD